MGAVAERNINRGRPSLSKEEVIEFLKKAEKTGLIHNCIMDSSIESSIFVCNCCSCHCGTLISSKEHRENAVLPSNFISRFNHELCTKCDICLNKCQRGAIYHKWGKKEDKSDEFM